MFRAKTEEFTGGWKKFHNDELHNLYASKNIIKMTKLWSIDTHACGEKNLQNYCRKT